LAEIDSMLKKLDWCDGGGEGREAGKQGGALLLCSGLIMIILLKIIISLWFERCSSFEYKLNIFTILFVNNTNLTDKTLNQYRPIGNMA